jgi:hypothetical protein
MMRSLMAFTVKEPILFPHRSSGGPSPLPDSTKLQLALRARISRSPGNSVEVTLINTTDGAVVTDPT